MSISLIFLTRFNHMFFFYLKKAKRESPFIIFVLEKNVNDLFKKIQFCLQKIFQEPLVCFEI
jgi:hypothetical protein